MKLVNAMRTNDALTHNGAVTHSTSNSALLDLFFVAGASRTMSEIDIINMFIKAYHENQDLALSLLLWARDIRGGAGERRFFHIIYGYLKNNYKEDALRIMKKIPDVGRWSDLWQSPLSTEEMDFIKENLHNKLLLKWIPRRTKEFYQLAKHCGYSLGDFRRLLSTSKVVEQQMSKNDWSSIFYSSVPSRAMAKYNKSFWRHDGARFQKYLKDVDSGKEKINASTLYPYDIIKMVERREKTATQLWNALPNYGNDENILVVADVSGSMTGLPMCVSISLAMYTSERNKGIFKDCFITFSRQPTLQELKGDIFERYRQLHTADWQQNTDLQAVFDMVLTSAVTNHVPQHEMPTKILIISDIEFDHCCVGQSNLRTIRYKYEQSGYVMPQLVFWNVNGRSGNVPIKMNDSGVALISGCSPAILQSVFGEISPMQVMLKTIQKEKYIC